MQYERSTTSCGACKRIKRKSARCCGHCTSRIMYWKNYRAARRPSAPDQQPYDDGGDRDHDDQDVQRLMPIDTRHREVHRGPRMETSRRSAVSGPQRATKYKSMSCNRGPAEPIANTE